MGPLWCRSEMEELPPKVLAVLWLLATQAGKIVSKATLLDTVWSGTFVTEGTLATCLSRLRDSLGDDIQQPRYVATVHRLGYRFVAPVMRGHPEQPSSVPPAALISSPLSWPLDPLLVGREKELARLHACFRDSQEGKRQTVFVTGEPGAGKTALLEAFLGQLGDELPVLFGHGQCIEHSGQPEPYLPLLDALSQMSRTRGAENVVECLRRYAPAWLEYLPALFPETQAPVRAKAHSLTPVGMLRELVEALEALSADRLVMLVVEDLQWSDPSTADALALLARRRDPARLLIVGTCRPTDLILRNHPLKNVREELLAHAQCTEVPLECLRTEDVSSYLQRRGATSERRNDLAAFVFSRTQGHPLFMTQVVDHLAQQDLLSPQKRNAPDLTFDRALPQSLRQVLEAHLGRLDATEQQVLEVGSVAGAEFVVASVAVGLEMPPNAVEAVCERLVRQGRFLEDHGPAEWPDGTVSSRYGWRHALYREVLYQRIGAGRLVRLHRLLGNQKASGVGCS